MSNLIRTRALGLAAAVTTALATITLTSAPAQAADCHAPAGESCLQITNRTTQVRSLRESRTNRCVPNILPGRTYEVPSITWNDWRHRLRFQGYTGRNCEGNTRFDGWDGTFDGPDSRNFNNITIYNR